jgi:tRNA(Arg) A34 adenosine deaminase TadA
MAIRDACRNLGTFDLSGCEIYASCEPCPMCLAAIYWARLDGLVFAASRTDAARAGFDDEVLYSEVTLPIAQRSIPTRQILAEQAWAGFAAWLQNPAKVDY